MGKHMPILGATSFSIKSYRDKLVEAGAQGLVGKENADQLAQYYAYVQWRGDGGV